MLKIKYPFSILLFFTAFILNLQAQQNRYSITGTILDERSVEPLFYVTVGLLNETDSTVVSSTNTDKNGIFELTNVNQGNYILKTHYIGYDIYQQSIVVSGENKELKLEQILLHPVSTNLSGVTIATTKPVYVNDGDLCLF